MNSNYIPQSPIGPHRYVHKFSAAERFPPAGLVRSILEDPAELSVRWLNATIGVGGSASVVEAK